MKIILIALAILATAQAVKPAISLIGRPEDGEVPGEGPIRKTSSKLQVHPGLPHELHLYQQGDHGTGLIGTNHP